MKHKTFMQKIPHKTNKTALKYAKTTRKRINTTKNEHTLKHKTFMQNFLHKIVKTDQIQT